MWSISKYEGDVVPKSQKIAIFLIIVAIIAIGIYFLSNIWITLTAMLIVPLNIFFAKAIRMISENWHKYNLTTIWVTKSFDTRSRQESGNSLSPS